MKKFQDRAAARRASQQARNRKLHLEYGEQITFLDWRQIVDYTGVSRSTAYRWIDNPDSIPYGAVELLRLKALGAVPGWGPGWRVDGDGLRMPGGRYLTGVDLENAGMAHQLSRLLQHEVETLSQENARLHSIIGVPAHIRRRLDPDEVPALRLVYDSTGTD